ncbi:MAG TPA: TRAM domain-containing protein, partial [Bacteroidales bacterium]|nr:TRAM domain-containing protein [Bacteroidales bacterium]
MESRHHLFRQVVENVDITGFAAEGRALGRIGELVVFVDFGAPGDVVDVLIKKTKSNFLEGEIVNIRKPSPDRVQPVCKHFGLCGGCRWQHLSYDKQLEYKQQQVVDSLERIGKIEKGSYRLLPIAGSENPYFYRNKLEFTFTNRKWLTHEDFVAGPGGQELNALGFHIPGMFDKVFDVQECWLQPEPSN